MMSIVATNPQGSRQRTRYHTLPRGRSAIQINMNWNQLKYADKIRIVNSRLPRSFIALLERTFSNSGRGIKQQKQMTHNAKLESTWLEKISGPKIVEVKPGWSDMIQSITAKCSETPRMT